MKTLALIATIAATASCGVKSNSSNLKADNKKPVGELCKGANNAGTPMTVIWNQGAETVTINTRGQHLVFNNLQYLDAGDVATGFVSDDKKLKVTFYDEDNSASGWSAATGPFKLKCRDL